ncbi:PaaI family thioesterase [Antrihabitans sp. YC2-6]|uniref:PaaI family thioesterase n=1 Tax=Antrihabitans sp. YC2-6 TaxID=2799498 RepID=UPI0018F58B40|nr:PaaI family thioesterase [Antrihabitans sp. YC2-6]
MHDAKDISLTSSNPCMSDWLSSMQTTEHDSALLPPHHGDCLGCGPANPHGHHLRAYRHGDGVVAGHVFDGRHVGAPGIAHGGAVATVLDDLFGFVLYVVGELAVTRKLEVDYLAPVLLQTEYTLHAQMLSRNGRKLRLRAKVEDQNGRVVATADALFIVVGPAHFTSRAPVIQARR